MKNTPFAFILFLLICTVSLIGAFVLKSTVPNLGTFKTTPPPISFSNDVPFQSIEDIQLALSQRGWTLAVSPDLPGPFRESKQLSSLSTPFNEKGITSRLRYTDSAGVRRTFEVPDDHAGILEVMETESGSLTHVVFIKHRKDEK